jgi:hypothetical protein
MTKKIIFTKETLFMAQAPSWNFELDEDQLLDTALGTGFVTKIGDDKYLMNNEYVNKYNDFDPLISPT